MINLPFRVLFCFRWQDSIPTEVMEGESSSKGDTGYCWQTGIWGNHMQPSCYNDMYHHIVLKGNIWQTVSSKVSWVLACEQCLYRPFLSFQEPTPIQRQAIPIGLQNRDIIGVAETGLKLAFNLQLILLQIAIIITICFCRFLINQT